MHNFMTVVSDLKSLALLIYGYGQEPAGVGGVMSALARCLLWEEKAVQGNQ